MQAMADLAGDAALGIRMVQTVDTAVHPPSSLAAFYARDYRDGLTRIARFKRLCTPEHLVQLSTETPLDGRDAREDLVRYATSVMADLCGVGA